MKTLYTLRLKETGKILPWMSKEELEETKKDFRPWKYTIETMEVKEL